MLTAMEKLCAGNPAIGRFGIQSLAELAIEDTKAQDQKLWKQGAGRKNEYLDEMKSDQGYHA